MAKAFNANELAWIEEANTKAIATGRADELLLARSLLKQGTIFEMARPRTKSKEAEDLLDALAFVVGATKGTVSPWQQHCTIVSGMIVASDGMISAGHPLDLAIEQQCCPHYGKLVAALKKVGKTLAMTLTANSRLSVIGDNSRFLVPCLPLADYPDVEWDDPFAPADDSLKAAFEVCNAIADENATDFLEASINVQPGYCSVTDRSLVVQARHGLHMVPVGTTLPKKFTHMVAKCKEKIVKIGATPGTSFTVHFENGAWIKTLVYADEWPVQSVNTMLNVETNLQEVPKDLFEAIETCVDFTDPEVPNTVLIGTEVVSSHLSDELGCQITVKGFDGHDKQVNATHFKAIAPFVSKMDFATDANRIYFGSEMVRGVMTTSIGGMKG